jgi:hypothetical protein
VGAGEGIFGFCQKKKIVELRVFSYFQGQKGHVMLHMSYFLV